MIARLTGVLEEKTPDYLVVNVNGVGYQVFVSLQTFYRLPALHERVTLHVHTHLREEASWKRRKKPVFSCSRASPASARVWL